MDTRFKGKAKGVRAPWGIGEKSGKLKKNGKMDFEYPL